MDSIERAVVVSLNTEHNRGKMVVPVPPPPPPLPVLQANEVKQQETAAVQQVSALVQDMEIGSTRLTVTLGGARGVSRALMDKVHQKLHSGTWSSSTPSWTSRFQYVTPDTDATNSPVCITYVHASDVSCSRETVQGTTLLQTSTTEGPLLLSVQRHASEDVQPPSYRTRCKRITVQSFREFTRVSAGGISGVAWVFECAVEWSARCKREVYTALPIYKVSLTMKRDWSALGAQPFTDDHRTWVATNLIGKVKDILVYSNSPPMPIVPMPEQTQDQHVRFSNSRTDSQQRSKQDVAGAHEDEFAPLLAERDEDQQAEVFDDDYEAPDEYY